MNEHKQEWSFSAPPDGQVFPEDFVQLVWSYLQWSSFDKLKRRPNLPSQLRELVLRAFQASLASEEGRPVTFQTVFHPRIERLTIEFEDPLHYKASELIRIAPTIGLEGRYLVVAPHERMRALQIEGIVDPDILPDRRAHQRFGDGLLSSQDVLDALTLSVHGPGWVRIATAVENFELKNCSFRRRLLVGQIKYVLDWFTEIPHRLGFKSHVGDLTSDLCVALAHRFLVNVLNRISTARHGGCLIVLPDRLQTAARHLKLKYAAQSDVLRRIMRARATVAPKAYEESHAHSRMHGAATIHDETSLADALILDRDLDQAVELVASLSAVDGAVLIGRDFTLHGFGAEITLSGTVDPNKTVDVGNSAFGQQQIPPPRVVEFGMRHRSALRFCEEVPDAMAFVISQDGGIRLFRNVAGRVRQFVDIAAEEL